MTRVRDVMTQGAECVKEGETLKDAAVKMRDLDVGALPICGDDGRLKGMLTDRDIVVRCIADGGDPTSVTAGSLAQGKPVTIGADDDLDEAIRVMVEHQVRRLPVIDGHDLIGIVAQADIAESASNEQTGRTVEGISE
jgi:CBS domain-containing protein